MRHNKHHMLSLGLVGFDPYEPIRRQLLDHLIGAPEHDVGPRWWVGLAGKYRGVA